MDPLRRRLTLIRMKESDICTLGRIETEDAHQLCVTLEEPWKDENKDGISDRSVSRIPAGEYVFHRYLSPKRGIELFKTEDVKGRTAIEIHVGNTTTDTEGCILVGSGYATNAITGSKLAFEKFMKELQHVQQFTLVVRDVPPLKKAA